MLLTTTFAVPWMFISIGRSFSSLSSSCHAANSLLPCSHAISVLLRLLTYVSSNKTRLSYHWPELWRALLTLTRFLTTYSGDLSSTPHIHELTAGVIDLITFCISAGDTFLPDPASYDDLFYKVVEAGPVLSRFREIYKKSALSSSAKAGEAKTATDDQPRSIDTLIDVSNHFHALLFHPEQDKSPPTPVTPTDSSQQQPPAPSPKTARKKNLSPREVHSIIKQGYETLSIRSHEGLSNWEKWREADWKPQLKRITRMAVEDARTVATKPGGVNIISGSTGATLPQK